MATPMYIASTTRIAPATEVPTSVATGRPGSSIVGLGVAVVLSVNIAKHDGTWISFSHWGKEDSEDGAGGERSVECVTMGHH